MLPLYDALYDSKKLKHVLTRHEQGAVHAADAMPVLQAKSVFVLLLPARGHKYGNRFNQCLYGFSTCCCYYRTGSSVVNRKGFFPGSRYYRYYPADYQVQFSGEKCGRNCTYHQKAFYIAKTGRPGPVLIDLPKDLTLCEAEYNHNGNFDIPGYRLPEMSGNGVLVKVVDLISQAEKPVICAGGGILKSGSEKELLALAEQLDIPVAVTLMGKSAFPENHRLFLGMVGMHGTAYANYAVSECDLLVGIGMRFADRVTGNVSNFASNGKIVHIDIDPAEIDKNVITDLHVVGDARAVLSRILELAGRRRLPAWHEKIAAWKEDFPLEYENKEGGLKPQFVVEKISEITGGRAFIATEVGQHQMWASHYYKSVVPRSFVTSGGLGTMGFGLPAALGVQIANPEAVVFDIAGDGSIQMNIQELCTAVQYQLPVNVAILNNRYLGMVRQWQELFHDSRYSQTDISCQPDFVALAKAYGCDALRVDNEEILPALEQAIASPKPFVIDFWVEREENVFPMVPAGGSINKMIRG